MESMTATLTHNCTKISASHITSLVRTPPLLDVLKAYRGDLNDETVCKIICDTALGLSVFDPQYRKTYRMARCIYNDVHKEIPIWLYKKAQVPAGYEDQSYLLDILSPLGYHSKRVLLAHTGFLDAARKHRTIADIQTAYLVFESVFFQMIRRRFRKSRSEEQRNQYMVFRNIADEFCTIVFEDKTVWRERLAAKLS